MSVRLQFEGIRCFSEAQDAIVRPLTLLVGENGSGKSTFLALCQIASSISDSYDEEFPCDFNEPPFLLGAFEQIASYRGGRAGRSKSFSIAVSVDDGDRSGSIRADFMSKSGQPSLRAWRLAVGNSTWEVTFNGSRETVSLAVESAQGRHRVPDAPRTMLSGLLDLPLRNLAGEPELKFLETLFSESEWESFITIPVSIRQWFGQRRYALAPIRTSPRRTYDPVNSKSKPEGPHVPMLLSLLSRCTAKNQWTELRGELGEIGSKPGLFEGIEVIRKGKKGSDPLQIGVKSGGPRFNLIGVGYGASQALPSLADILQRPAANETFLLQQPEVHLHPRAQAELGSFFAQQAGEKRRFVIETHSDHLVDRVRMEVRRGTLRPDDVSLLYFERRKHGATIHNLDLDKGGSITNAPDGFREFFLDEANDLLGI